MNRIAVGETIRFAYQFTFGQIGTIIGLIWVPTLIQVVGTYFVLAPYYAAMAAAAESHDYATMGPHFLMLMAFEFVALGLQAVIAAALIQQALGLRQGQPFFHFSFGLIEMRLLGGMLGLFFLFIIFILIAALGAGIVTTAIVALLGRVTPMSMTLAQRVGFPVSLLALLCLVYPMARLSFFFPPAVVAESGFGIARSWQLSKGNFWRIAGVGLATLLPVFVLVIGGEIAVIGPKFFASNFMVLQDGGQQMQAMAAQMRVMQAHLPLLLGLGFVITPVMFGLIYAPSAFAYRALTRVSTQA
jgi:hypothetical protein